MIVLDKVADIVVEAVVDNAVDSVSFGRRRFVMYANSIPHWTIASITHTI